MSTEKSHIGIEVLDRVKDAYNLPNDTKLADFLGVSQSTVANWRARESFNLELIITNCNNLNLNWLIYGVGPKFLKDGVVYHTINEPSVQYSEKRMIGRVRHLPISNEEKLELVDMYIDFLYNRAKKNEEGDPSETETKD